MTPTMCGPEPLHLTPEFPWPPGITSFFGACTVLRTIVEPDDRAKHYVRFEPGGYEGIVWFVSTDEVCEDSG